MNTHNDNCQSAMTQIRSALRPLAAKVQTPAKGQPATILLNMTTEQLALTVAALGSDSTTPHVIIFERPLAACRQLQHEVNHWSRLLDVNQSWHTISDELTAQEVRGDAMSQLNQTMHYLLTGAPNRHFIIPAAALDSRIPDPRRYQDESITFTTGQNARQSTVVKRLVELGYTRFDKSIETGGIRVRGEQVDIDHPIFSGPHTITFYGSVIERIVAHVNKRQHPVNSIAISPVRFPQSTVPLTKSLNTMTIYQPQHITNLSNPITIIYDALHPEHTLPLQPADAINPGAQWLVLYQNKDRVQAYLDRHRITSAALCSTPLAGRPIHLSDGKISLVSEAAMLPDYKPAREITYREGQALVAELTEGKPAVHSDHGIGMYEGLHERTINGSTREYLILRYAAGDSLSVPVEAAYKVTAYVGAATPPISRLNSAAWQATRRRAQHDAEAFAKKLLITASRRKKQHRQRYQINQDIENSLNDSFEFTLTPHQQQAWQEIAADLTRPEPMDRLVVGDVGFGKTEVAARAARHVIANGKQVALLAPTTLLVQQHTDTLKKRLPDVSGRIATLSRFATAKEIAQVHQRIQAGDVDLVIGTHALLNKKISWRDLGLVVIDEEQRFGVTHKEHFKKLRARIDILSLSATPIPRTLSMALSDLKKLSIISSPPGGRKSVTTSVAPDSDAVLKDAITAELERAGQVYLVAPKIHQLSALARRSKKLVPEAVAAIAHGQLPPRQLAAIMQQFDKGELDVLVSSTIIENGIDLPNANTIIVTHATHFGLADLYQLRGRVGRRRTQGHAHFLYNQGDLTSVQRKRLTALTEAARLGSGWSIAQRDLEIRGAGNLLGAEQSGSVNDIGVQLYLDMVDDALAQSDSQSIRRRDVDIQITLDASIPTHYIADQHQRSRIYQQLSRARSLKDLDQLLRTITGTYGPAPTEVQNLYLLIRLQHTAAKAGITRIESRHIAPPDLDAYHQLIITLADNSSASKRLTQNNGWDTNNDNTLVKEIDRITPQTVKTLIKDITKTSMTFFPSK